MKKLIALLLAFACVFALFGCSKSTEEREVPESTGNAPQRHTGSYSFFGENEYIQITRLTTVQAGITIAGGAQLHPGIHTGGNVDGDGLLAVHAALTTALRAGVGDGFTRTAAGGASALLYKEAALARNHTAAVAGGAGLEAVLTIFGARGTAGITGHQTLNLDGLRAAGGSLLQRDVQVIAQV